jgi:AraC-like DNA-binding protein/mannose-6-phosphate isomerase-like protein (cupin superfamily)
MRTPAGRIFTPTPPSEGVRIHADSNTNYPVEVFGNHQFCAGVSTTVYTMASPHMHSQVELNFILNGAMTYWYDGRELTLNEGQLALFWGMIPHQAIACEEGTQFVVIYVPMSVFIELPVLSRLREAIFRGALIEALDVKPYDGLMFQRWREDLLADDVQLEQIVRDELTARVRRIDREGWHDLREVKPLAPHKAWHSLYHDRAVKVENMARFISEHALEDISAEQVAGAVELHPNYAMTLFKKAMGLTIKQSITRHRLDTAQSMLIGSDLAVASIAFDCGFGSLSSFYAAFEQRFNKSPAAFRNAFADKLRT